MLSDVPLLATFDFFERKIIIRPGTTRAPQLPLHRFRETVDPPRRNLDPLQILIWLDLPRLLQDEPENRLQRILFVIDADDDWLVGASR